MAITAVEVIKYQASDGIIYDTREQAERAEFIGEAAKSLLLSVEMTPAEVLDAVFDNRVTIVTLLQRAVKSDFTNAATT